MARSRARRNVIVVVLLFGFVAVLVVLAGTLGGAPSIGPESPEISRIRLSTTENGYFTLLEAMSVFPALGGGNVVTDIDFEMGPKAESLGVPLKEDDPAIAAAIEESRPAVEMARRAVQMPYLLVPVDWKKFKDFRGANFFDLFTRMHLVATEDGRDAKNEQQAVDVILDYHRLTWKCIDGLGMRIWGGGSNFFARTSLLLQCPESFQQRLLAGLRQLRAEWQPPRYWLDNSLRIFEARRASLTSRRGLRGVHDLTFQISERARAAKARPLLAKNHDTLQKVSGYTKPQFEAWKNENPALADAVEFGLFDFRMRDICESNSAYLLDLDACILVLVLEQYRRAHGGYPETLDELVPDYIAEKPIDVYTGKEFGYRREESDYRLYSYGSDGKDGGGQLYPRGSDWAIHLPPEK